MKPNNLIELSSEEERRWCENRRLRISKVKLRYEALLKIIKRVYEMPIVEEEPIEEPLPVVSEPIQDLGDEIIHIDQLGRDAAFERKNKSRTGSQKIWNSVKNLRMNSNKSIWRKKEDQSPISKQDAPIPIERIEYLDRDYNLLHYIDHAIIGNESEYTNISWDHCQEIFQQFYSIQSIIITHGVLKHRSDVDALVEQLLINQNREFDPIICQTIKLLNEDYQYDLIKPLMRIPLSVTSFQIHSSQINLKFLKQIGWNWFHLNQIDINGNSENLLTDFDLNEFYDQGNQQKFNSIRLTDCPQITIYGLIDFLFNSVETLKELKFDGNNIKYYGNNIKYYENNITTKLLPILINLEILDLSLSSHYSNELLFSIGCNCLQLKCLNVFHMIHSHDFTDEGIDSVSRSCHSMELFVLGKCPLITSNGMKMVFNRWNQTIKKVLIVNHEIKRLLNEEEGQKYLKRCRNKVNIILDTL